jgi:hypothetical protein
VVALPQVPNPSTWNPGDFVTASRLRADVSNTVAFHTDRPVLNVTPSDAQSIPNTTWTPVAMPLGAMADNYGGHSTSTNDSRYTAQVPGWYLAIGNVAFAPTSVANTSTFICGFRVNGVNDAGHLFEGAKHCGGANHGINPMCVELLKLNVGDYVELMAYQYSGGALNTWVNGNSFNASRFQLLWVAAISGTAPLRVPTQPTWADGVVVTSAALNTYVRDAARFLTYPPIARLTYNGTTPASQSMGNASWTTLLWDTATVDNYTGWAGTGSHPSHWVAPVTGHYLIAAQSAVTASFTGKRAVALLVNSSTLYQGQTLAAGASGDGAGTAVITQRVLKLNAGDYVEVQGYQSSGSSTQLSTGTNVCKFIAVWLCA